MHGDGPPLRAGAGGCSEHAGGAAIAVADPDGTPRRDGVPERHPLAGQQAGLSGTGASSATSAPAGDLVVFAVGNESRGDDALGPQLLARIEALGLPGVRCVAAFQLQIELVCDIEGAALLLFVDASRDGPAPFAFRAVGPQAGRSLSSHALAPEALLAVHAQVIGPPPPAFVLGVAAGSFALGEELSPAGARHLQAAWAFLQPLLAQPDVAAWKRAAEALRPPVLDVPAAG